MPRIPKDHVFRIPPDWVCEVVSPHTARLDRSKKMPVYAAGEVAHCWIVDPEQRTLEIFRLQTGSWVLMHVYSGDDKFSAEPFEAIEIDLDSIWGETEQ